MCPRPSPRRACRQGASFAASSCSFAAPARPRPVCTAARFPAFTGRSTDRYAIPSLLVGSDGSYGDVDDLSVGVERPWAQLEGALIHELAVAYRAQLGIHRRNVATDQLALRKPSSRSVARLIAAIVRSLVRLDILRRVDQVASLLWLGGSAAVGPASLRYSHSSSTRIEGERRGLEP